MDYEKIHGVRHELEKHSVKSARTYCISLPSSSSFAPYTRLAHVLQKKRITEGVVL